MAAVRSYVTLVWIRGWQGHGSKWVDSRVILTKSQRDMGEKAG